MDDEVAFGGSRFKQILRWCHLKVVITELEAHWFKYFSDIIAASWDCTESLITATVEVRQSFTPFCSKFIEDVRWDRELGATSVNDGWVDGTTSFLKDSTISISHTFSFKSPCSKPILVVFEGFEALCATNNLRWVISTEKCIRFIIHIFGIYTETNNSMINDFIVLKWP